MSQNEFASQLTKLGLPASLDADSLAAMALSRNRRRIRGLSALTIGLWIVTFLFVPAFWMPFAAKMKQQAILLQGISSGKPPVTLETVTHTLQQSLLYIAGVSGAILAITTIVSLLAAISTVWLVLTVRRVTLEQLALGLSQIAEELKRLRVPPA